MTGDVPGSSSPCASSLRSSPAEIKITGAKTATLDLAYGPREAPVRGHWSPVIPATAQHKLQGDALALCSSRLG
jgi:hypothetical protein